VKSTQKKPFTPSQINLQTSRNLLRMLDERIEASPGNAGLWLRRADLARHAGMVPEIRHSIAQYRRLTLPGGRADVDPRLLVPPTGLAKSTEPAPSPVIVIDGFVPDTMISEILDQVATNRDQFEQARVGIIADTENDDARITSVFHKYTAGRDFILSRIRALQPDACRLLGIPDFTIGHMETKITNYTTGGHFHPHQDATEWSQGQRRTLSWLLYFHRQPKKFTGGDLYMLDTYPGDETTPKHYIQDKYTRIEPANNRLVMFRSADYHAVAPTILHGDDFMDGRMAVSGHISNS